MTMREVKYRTVERWPNGHFNPHKNLIVRYRGRDFELECGAGSADRVYVYRCHELVHVLVVNRGLGYVGLSAYQLDRRCDVQNAMAECFFQYDWEVADVLGKRGVDLEPREIRKRLAPYTEC
jgi:hypothetical protein